MKEIKFVFYKVNPSSTNIGFKFVLYAIADAEGNITYDWGFANWNGLAWDELEVPEGYQVKVERWANTVDPELLLKEKNIITIG